MGLHRGHASQFGLSHVHWKIRIQMKWPYCQQDKGGVCREPSTSRPIGCDWPLYGVAAIGLGKFGEYQLERRRHHLYQCIRNSPVADRERGICSMPAVWPTCFGHTETIQGVAHASGGVRGTSGCSMRIACIAILQYDSCLQFDQTTEEHVRGVDVLSV